MLVISMVGATVSALTATVGASTEASTSRRTPRLVAAGAGMRPDGTMSPAAARALRGGPLPIDEAALARDKARAEARAGQASNSPDVADTSPPPTNPLEWKGIFDTGSTPSDSTGAIGENSYIETVNVKAAIYDRSGTLINQTTLQNWWGAPGTNSFDPQVIWDPDTDRFFYTGDIIVSSSDHRLSFGFSRNASPVNFTNDWCRYSITYGSEFPDYPKLGDSLHFLIIGVNTFAGNSFRGSDIVAISKPPSGGTCPDASTFKVGAGFNIKVAGVSNYTPVPANQTDGNSTGWVVSHPGGSSAKIGLFQVTKNSDGTPNIQTSGVSIGVEPYTVPPSAPQGGTNYDLDTLDGRFTQAVSAVDPSRNNKVGLWTQHTVAGGAGSMVRWYEIDPAAAGIFQKGAVKHSTLYYYNGAVSPDRKVNGGNRAFGSNMILGFNSSNSQKFIAIRMVSKRAGDTVSKPVTVRTSPGPNIDFSCSPAPDYCRWGDYAAATPDPAPASVSTGTVWLTSMWTKDGNTTGGTSGVSWQTWNWVAVP